MYRPKTLGDLLKKDKEEKLGLNKPRGLLEPGGLFGRKRTIKDVLEEDKREKLGLNKPRGLLESGGLFGGKRTLKHELKKQSSDYPPCPIL